MVYKKFAHSISAYLACVAAALFLLYEPEISPVICETLSVFIKKVLPPLFPFMVISKVIVSGGYLNSFAEKIRIARFFNLPDSAGAVILCGFLCGFPVGAAITADLYERGKLSKSEAGRLTALSSNTSPAFIIGTAAILWNSRRYGIFLLAIQFISAVVIAFLMKSDKYYNIPKKIDLRSQKNETEEIGFVPALCRAISESASGCLSVCAYIVFFRAVSSIICCIIPPLSLFVTALFEFSSGCIAGASHGGVIGCFITGFSVGFSGISVVMQIYNYIGKYNIPIRVYLITKLLQGLICGTASTMFYSFLKPVPSDCAAAFAEISSLSDSVGYLIILSSICFSSRMFELLTSQKSCIK